MIHSLFSVTAEKLRPCSSTLVVVLVATLALCCHPCTGKKNRDVFHGHRGVFPPYEAGPFESLDLNKGDEKVLESGKPIMKQNQGSGDELGGGAICVQDVAAPKEAVWSQILDLDSYKGKVPKVNECKNYLVKKNEDGTSTIKTKMALKVIPGYGVSIIFFYDFCFVLVTIFFVCRTTLEKYTSAGYIDQSVGWYYFLRLKYFLFSTSCYHMI